MQLRESSPSCVPVDNIGSVFVVCDVEAGVVGEKDSLVVELISEEATSEMFIFQKHRRKRDEEIGAGEKVGDRNSAEEVKRDDCVKRKLLSSQER